MKVASGEFQQNVGKFQDAAQHEPVVITRHGRDHTVLISAVHFELLLKGRLARKTEELDSETVQAIAGSSVSEEFSSLDSLIKDWAP